MDNIDNVENKIDVDGDSKSKSIKVDHSQIVFDRQDMGGEMNANDCLV